MGMVFIRLLPPSLPPSAASHSLENVLLWGNLSKMVVVAFVQERGRAGWWGRGGEQIPWPSLWHDDRFLAEQRMGFQLTSIELYVTF